MVASFSFYHMMNMFGFSLISLDIMHHRLSLEVIGYDQILLSIVGCGFNPLNLIG